MAIISWLINGSETSIDSKIIETDKNLSLIKEKLKSNSDLINKENGTITIHFDSGNDFPFVSLIGFSPDISEQLRLLLSGI